MLCNASASGSFKNQSIETWSSRRFGFRWDNRAKLLTLLYTWKKTRRYLLLRNSRASQLTLSQARDPNNFFLEKFNFERMPT